MILGMKKTLLIIAASILCLVPNLSKNPPCIRLFQPTEKACMQVNLFFEARGESYRGMQAVAAVTYNRTESKAYKGSVCQVVFAPRQFSWTHQQPYDKILALLDGDTKNLTAKDKQRFQVALDIASKPRVEFLKILPRDVLHYHSVKVNPYWKNYKVKVATIGKHVFYTDSKLRS
jgi:N-acetylmuramoyl-L-alanine amidase